MQAKTVEPRQAPKMFEVVSAERYQIGVGCRGLDDALRVHLKIDHGVVVDFVQEGSPAAQAGLRKHDILLQAGDKQLQTFDDLAVAIQVSEGADIVFKAIQRGEKKSLTITPTLGTVEQARVTIEKAGLDELRKWAETLQKANPEKLHMRAVGPRVIIMSAKSNPLPEGVSVKIQTHGQQQAPTITVRWKDQTWKVTPDQIEKLPKEIRFPLLAMFMPKNPAADFVPEVTIDLEHEPLESIQKQVEQIMQQLEALRRQAKDK